MWGCSADGLRPRPKKEGAEAFGMVRTGNYATEGSKARQRQNKGHSRRRKSPSCERYKKEYIYKTTEIMIHYGKAPSGDLEIRVSPDDVGGIYAVLQSAGLMQRRGEYNGLKEYIKENFDV